MLKRNNGERTSYRLAVGMTTLAAVLLLVCTGTSVAATLPVVCFNQCDPIWSDDWLVGGGQVICSQGRRLRQRRVM